MYMYINEKENLYPRFPGDIQLIDPTWTVDKPLPEGWETVVLTPMPDVSVGEVPQEIAPEKKDGIWYQKWSIRNLTEEELEIIRKMQEEAIIKINESQQ